MNAVSPIDLPMHVVCTEIVLDDRALIVVGMATSASERAIECPPRHAVQAAEMLLDHALTLEPDLVARQSTPLASIMERLWRVAGAYLPQLLKHDHCANLRGVIDREVRSRVTEELIGVREAARKRGLADAADTIRRLLAICNEPDDRVRAVALTGMQGDIARVTADLDAGITR